MKFTAEYRVDTHDTDLKGIASATSVIQYIQESANLQHEAYGPKLDDLRKSGKAFILSRMAIDFLRPLKAQDIVKVETWLNEAKGYGYLRNSRLTRGDELVARMTAFWGVIDIPTRKLLRAEEIELGFGTDPEEVSTDAGIRFRIPKELELSKLGDYKVVYRDCDENLHMNNTQYPGVFCDFLPEMLRSRITGISINYQHEAKLGCSFEIFGARDGDVIYIRTRLDDGNVGAEAMMSISSEEAN